MQSLGEKDVQLLCAGQNITGVVSALKELIENSLDAGAKTIKIRLVESGLTSISVTDDGSGITPEGRELCGLAHTTSKISSLTELRDELTTFGFRGEALNSLCVQADVTIITRTRDESLAQKLTLDHDGKVTRMETIPANVGTTVVAEKILSVYPVRRMSEQSRVTKEALQGLLQKYYLAAPTVRFVLDAIPICNLTRPPLSTITQAFTSEFGSKVAANLVERQVEGYAGDIRVKIRGLIPTATSDWKMASTIAKQVSQFIILNGRPIQNVDFADHIDTYYRSHFGSIPKRYTRFVLLIDCYRDTNLTSTLFDVNRDAAKSSALFREEGTIMKLLDQLMSFDEKQAPQFKRLNEWPSKSIQIDRSPFDVTMLGTCKWTSAGKVGDVSLFSVTDPLGSLHLVSLKADQLFNEVMKVPRAEIERGNMAELIPIYWDQIMELHGTTPQIKHICHIT